MLCFFCGQPWSPPSDLVAVPLIEAMVPLIEERLQDFRPRELVHVADAYASWAEGQGMT